MDGKWRLIAATTLSAAVALAAPSAMAAPCLPEQTVAALDQYCEALPTPVGAAAPTSAGSGNVVMRPLSAALPPRVADRLRQAGPAARALLLLPVVAPLARAPMTEAERRRGDRGAREVIDSGPLESRKGNVSSVASGLAIAAPDVVGGAFRWALVVSSLGLAGMAWLRLRSRLRL